MRKSSAARAAMAAAFFSLAALNVPAAGAVTVNVVCPGQSVQTAVSTVACSGDNIEISGTCNEAVTVSTTNAGCPGGALPFTDLSIRGQSGKKAGGATVIEGVGGPGITVTGNAIRIKIENLAVGSDTSHGIAIVGAHRVIIDNITTPSPGGTVDDGINVDTASTHVQVNSSTLNVNPGDGLEMGATYGMVNNVTANDNGGAGISITGSNVSVQRATAFNTAAGNAQMFGFQTAGATVVIERSNAQDNTIAQFHDTPASTGVIHFRNTAGNPRAAAPAASGKGYWERGSGNYISSATILRNAEEGVHLAGNGNQLQLSSVKENVLEQVLITGDANVVTNTTATRVSTGPFTSVMPAFHVLAGSMFNFFNRTSASVSGTTLGDGYTIVSAAVPDPTTTGERNARRPTVAGDPPDALK